MIALIQRVTQASVEVDGLIVGRIGAGLLALLAVEPADTTSNVTRMVERLLGYRVFQDAANRMNLSLRDTNGGLLLVPQFTLAADTRKGTRPGFSTAATPEKAQALFDALCREAAAKHDCVATGRFGTHMRVSLINDGPVTFRLDA